MTKWDELPLSKKVFSRYFFASLRLGFINRKAAKRTTEFLGRTPIIKKGILSLFLGVSAVQNHEPQCRKENYGVLGRPPIIEEGILLLFLLVSAVQNHKPRLPEESL